MLSDSFHHLQILSEHIFGLVSIQRLQDYKSTLLSGLLRLYRDVFFCKKNITNKKAIQHKYHIETSNKIYYVYI